MSDARSAPRWTGALEGLAHTLDSAADGACIRVERDALHAVLTALKERAGFEMCTFVTAIDHYPSEPRFELHHQLLSLTHGDRVRVRTAINGNDAWAPTCADLWPGANWSERECFDMFGLEFRGHPDLRRLLMPEGYEHHPLRKDFPHHGIEPDKLYREWDRKRRETWSAPSGSEAR